MPVRAADTEAADVSACRSCGAPIVWVDTEHGRKMPLDRDPYTGDDARGLFVLRAHYPGETTVSAVMAVAVPPDAFDEPHYRSHFATCPQADSWRSKGGR